MGVQITFTPDLFHLTPRTNNFPSVTPYAPNSNPPSGSYPVVTGFHFSVSNRTGPDNLTAAFQDAYITFVARQKNTKTPQSWIEMGTLKGRMRRSGNDPVFECHEKSNKGKDTKYKADFSNDLIKRSDFVLRMGFPSSNTSVKSANSPMWPRLPWIFDAKYTGASPGAAVQAPPPVFELNARLYVNNAKQADETNNASMDVPMEHRGIPHNGVPTNPQHTYYGVRTIYSMSNTVHGSTRVPVGTNTVNVYIHESVGQRLYVTDADVGTHVENILNEAGFSNVNVETGTNGSTHARVHYLSHNRIYMSRNIPDGNRRDTVANEVKAGQDPTFFDGEERTVPFFDFSIFVEDRPLAPAGELGQAETLHPRAGLGAPNGVLAASTEKLVDRPITFAKDPVRAAMKNRVKKTYWDEFVASLIVHEIGHTLGLRHAGTIEITGSAGPPQAYASTFNPAGGKGRARGTMNWADFKSNNPEYFALRYFGPVHTASIRRYFL